MYVFARDRQKRAGSGRSRQIIYIESRRRTYQSLQNSGTAMEDHVNMSVTTDRQNCETKSTRVADARRQIFSGAAAGEYECR